MAEQARAAYVYDDQMSRHVLAEAHPMKPVRLSYTNALLQGYGAFEDPGALVVQPRPASEEELLTFHRDSYVDVVRRLSAGEELSGAERFGFSAGG